MDSWRRLAKKQPDAVAASGAPTLGKLAWSGFVLGASLASLVLWMRLAWRNLRKRR